MGIEWRIAKVGELKGPTQPRRFAEEGVIESYAGTPKSVIAGIPIATKRFASIANEAIVC